MSKQLGNRSYAQEQMENKNDVASRWHRGLHAAERIQDGDALYEATPDHTSSIRTKSAFNYGEWTEEEKSQALKKRRATFLGSLSMGIGKERDQAVELPFQSKALEQQHWLEMIDAKHRYGSNLKFYFRIWQEAETEDNFFRWLDKGAGKDLDLEVLPRERLEKERITYLSADQRLNYLVNVDRDGRLRWARNDELVDTAAGKWHDAGNGGGIIPDNPIEQINQGDGQEQRFVDDTAPRSSRSSVSYSAGSDLQDNEDTHYVGLDKDKGRNWLQRKTKGITPSGIRNDLLRKTVRRNTWIYVCDMKMNMFVGIKKSGLFQHSSFIAGGKLTSAGIIILKNGLIKSLNPLSGHYRSSIQHHRAFIAQLEKKGADLSHVKLAKSVFSLWGLAKYAAFTKGQKAIYSAFLSALRLSHEPTEKEKSRKLKQHSEVEAREHEERLKEVHRAEASEKVGQGSKQKTQEVISEAKREENKERKDDTKQEIRPT
ncbi:hypothetical protein M231_01424 [Tremella mesenterica]|uniref:IQ domain-containing calmodulin-binding protein n=1 Tax=Tremella mesenterica TaxID=5217 RepID=A0A4Q1BT82_TREME|nr:hypothetical protein M231_01424 [Tremella mesenterica]